eukprot:CAMPEP_0203817426 /NCGR_PEP_ID=MMETSP0115-20131106/25411_1 /ASSEMBLY_ACC=CAM_ASM_000227 /TAXON_ID=33651 /ORGANISM="Bicosoecid sp, Strain ms1" /LENGTH=356 /DNA_ID=CAMNT_0050726355 /DNA_START=8 /DNA_END=1076 /DNA_ORIENTATION=-
MSCMPAVIDQAPRGAAWAARRAQMLGVTVQVAAAAAADATTSSSRASASGEADVDRKPRRPHQRQRRDETHAWRRRGDGQHDVEREHERVHARRHKRGVEKGEQRARQAKAEEVGPVPLQHCDLRRPVHALHRPLVRPNLERVDEAAEAEGHQRADPGHEVHDAREEQHEHDDDEAEASSATMSLMALDGAACGWRSGVKRPSDDQCWKALTAMPWYQCDDSAKLMMYSGVNQNALNMTDTIPSTALRTSTPAESSVAINTQRRGDVAQKREQRHVGEEDATQEDDSVEHRALQAPYPHGTRVEEQQDGVVRNNACCSPAENELPMREGKEGIAPALQHADSRARAVGATPHAARA